MGSSCNSTTTDEQLVLLSSQGHKKAFELLYERYSGKVYGYFMKMNRNDAAKAQDLTQDLFLKIIQNQEGFDANRSFKTWMFSMANNMCKNIYRHEEVIKKADEEMAYSQNKSGIMKTDIDKSQFKKALTKALNELDSVKRSCFILRYKNDMSIKEIASITNTSEGTVKSRLFYTLRQLAGALKEFENI